MDSLAHLSPGKTSAYGLKRKTAQNVIIVGGGWSGLTAAVDLLDRGHHVTLFESARQLGGRARCVAFDQHRVDNGQHLLLGAYKATLSILAKCGISTHDVLRRKPLHLLVIDKNKTRFELAPGNLPAPLNTLTALLNLQGVPVAARIKTCWFLIKLAMNGFSLKKDISVAALLKKQPRVFIERLWEPLCLAALNTPIKDASAQIFLNVLKDTFTKESDASNLLIPVVDLANVYVHPAMNYIDQHGGTIHLGKKIVNIHAHPDSPSVVDADGNCYTADQLILATSPSATLALLENAKLLTSTQTMLRQFRYEPVCTIYLQYPEDISLPHEMVGLSHCTGQWVFDRRICGQPGLMAVVISASGPHTTLDKMTLAQLVSDELTALFDWPEAEKTLVIREKRATFQANITSRNNRPTNQTDEPRIWLCGDYTTGPYPATLESAVLSGLQCSTSIKQQNQG